MDVYILLGLDRKEYIIMKLKKEKGIIEVELMSKKKKVRCPNCNKFTNSVHSRLKPIRSVYLDSCGEKVNLIINKRRFHCYNCNKIFTEEMNLNTKNGSISNKIKIQMRKDLLDYNMTIDKIAIKNHVSKYIVRKELEEATSTIPEYQKNLPKVISFDEFKADTMEGKYAFILNNPIHKKVLDILPSRKKERLIEYFTHTKNRRSVEYIISDMYEPYLLVQKVMFPHAKYVVDRFHYTKYIMEGLDKIRIRLQKEYGIKSIEYKLLKNKKNVSLLRKYSNEIDWWVEQERYRNGHIVRVLPGDIIRELLKIDDDLHRGYQLKELFLDIIKHSTLEDAERQLNEFVELCNKSEIPEILEPKNDL